jgi:hypothetical protein
MASSSDPRWDGLSPAVVGGADFAASPLAPFAIDREARGQEIRGEHEYEWGSFA